MSSVLEVKDLRAGYGSAQVLHGLSLAVEQGEYAVILGANGVGKTTTLRAVAGLLRPWSGAVLLDGRPVDGLRADELVRLGIGVVPGPPGIFRDLSVIDNLRVGAFALGRDKTRGEQRLAHALEDFPILEERKEQTAGSLSGGEQRMLAIARALMGDPRVLLVDEASMGLSPVMVSAVFGLLDRVRRDGTTVLMAEQNVGALAVADRAFVMERGRIVREARGAEVAGIRDEVARAYLGRAPAQAGSRS